MFSGTGIMAIGEPAPRRRDACTFREAVLHIGVPKTGSTSIQAWLAARRDVLRARGVHVPDAAGGSNHAVLVNGAENEVPPPQLRALQAELAGLNGGASRIVFSSEMLQPRLKTAAQVRRLRQLLDPFVGRYRIIVYLRRQDEQCVSRFTTVLRSGRSWGDPLGRPPIDYDRTLRLWADVFGRESVRPRIYEPASLEGGNVVTDFIAAAGLEPWPTALATGRECNTSLRPDAQAFLDRVAGLGKQDGSVLLDSRQARKRLSEIMDREFSGPGLLPSRSAATAYYARCRAANEAVRAAWFPERRALFEEDFSRYPEVASAPPDAEAVLAVATRVVLALLTKREPAAAGHRNDMDPRDRGPDRRMGERRRA